MNIHKEISELRYILDNIDSDAEAELVQRYALRLAPHNRLSLYRRARIALGLLLRRLGLRPTRQLEPWLPGLKHAEENDGTQPLVIWALGTDRDTLRAACQGFVSMQETLSDRVPVLVTDVADFAFFSRLGWLVEYVPAFTAPADEYAHRKKRYLAWRYRGAPALPVSVGLVDGVRPEDLSLD